MNKNSSASGYSYIYPLLISLFLFILDQVLKYLVISRGGSWYSNAHISPIIYGLLVVSLVTVLGRVQLRELGKFGGCMVIGGGVGNLIDILYRRGVVDYLSLANQVWFNISDVMIVGGVLLVIWDFWGLRR